MFFSFKCNILNTIKQIVVVVVDINTNSFKFLHLKNAYRVEGPIFKYLDKQKPGMNISKGLINFNKVHNHELLPLSCQLL